MDSLRVLGCGGGNAPEIRNRTAGTRSLPPKKAMGSAALTHPTALALLRCGYDFEVLHLFQPGVDHAVWLGLAEFADGEQAGDGMIEIDVVNDGRR